MNVVQLTLFFLCFLAFAPMASAQEVIPVESTLLKIIEVVQIPAQQSGVIEDFQLREGDLVDRGQLLAKIDAKEKELEREKALAELMIAEREANNDINVRYSEKSHEVAQAELKRSLVATAEVENSVSASDIDRQRLVVEETRLAIEQAREKMKIAELTARLKNAELKIVEQQLSKHQVTSPIEGMIVEQFRRQGEWIEQSKPLVEIVRIDRLRAEGFVSGAVAAQGLQGKAVEVLVDYPQQKPITSSGKIVFVDPVVNPVDGKVRVWAEIENPQLKLRPGLRASMQILLSKQDD